jgi:NAD+ kinase
VVEIEIPMGREDMPQTVEVHFDGSHRIILQTGDRIRIVKSEESIKFVQLNQVSFLEVLHKKMREA